MQFTDILGKQILFAYFFHYNIHRPLHHPYLLLEENVVCPRMLSRLRTRPHPNVLHGRIHSGLSLFADRTRRRPITLSHLHNSQHRILCGVHHRFRSSGSNP